MDGAIKKQIITVVEPFPLSTIKDQQTGFGLVTALETMDNIFKAYGEIDEIDVEENAVKMMGPYNPAESLDRLIEHLEKGRQFAHAGGKTIAEAMMVSKGITFMEQTVTFNHKIPEWR